MLHTFRLHLYTVPRLRRSLVVSTLNDGWILEVLMQVIDILQHAQLATNTDIIDSAQMLCVFRQAHTTRVRDDRDIEFLGHEKNGQDFVDTTHSASVDLADVNSARGEELLENYAVLAHFSGSNADPIGAESVSDGFMAKNVVRGSWLFDEPGFELFEVLHVSNGFWDGPDLRMLVCLGQLRMRCRKYLVCINHQNIALVIPNHFSRNSQSLPVSLNRGPNLQLEMPVPLTQCLLQQRLHLLLPIS